MIKKREDYINIEPDKSLWKKLGRTSYTIAKAISELIDNSIDNRLDNKQKVNVDISFEINGDEIKIKDDAQGMDRDEIQKALTIAYHEDGKKTIGENGFGLKSATSYLGKKVNIYTKKINSSDIIKVEYIEGEFINGDDWKIKIQYINSYELKNEVNETLEHGTIIIIKDLNVKLYPALAIENDKNGRLIPILSRLYMIALDECVNIRLIIKKKDKKLNIIEEKITVKKYKFPDLMCKCNFSFFISNENSEERRYVKGWIGIFNPGLEDNNKNNKDIYKYKGFLITKNGKIILEREQLGYEFHPENRLITGVVNLEDFIPTNTKDSFIKDEHWTILEEIMSKVFVKAAKKISVSSFIKHVRENIKIGNENKFDLNNIFKEAISSNIEDMSVNDSILNRIDTIEYEICREVYNNYVKETKKLIELSKGKDPNMDNPKKKDPDTNRPKRKDPNMDNPKGKAPEGNKLNYNFEIDINIANNNIKIKHSIENILGELDYIWDYDEKSNVLDIKSLVHISDFNLIKDKKLFIINNIENAIFDYSILKNRMINKNILLEIRKEIKRNLVIIKTIIPK